MKELPPYFLEVLFRVTGAESIAETEYVQTLWGGYGELFRFSLKGGSYPTAIVKYVFPPPADAHPRGWNTHRSHQRKLRSYQVEAHWYEHYASRCGSGSPVPRCLAVHKRGSEYLLVLEDLDLQGFPYRKIRVGTKEIESCILWLAHFHATFLGEAPTGLWKIGTYWHLKTRPDEWEALPDSSIKTYAPEVDSLLNEAQFLTLVHGDAKLANFCFNKTGKTVAAVDFQYVGGGVGVKDLAYFLSSCLDEKGCERQEAHWLEFYFNGLKAALENKGYEGNFSDLETEWRALYPVAWTDFYRFLRGWAPEHPKIHGYSERLAREVISRLKSEN